MKTVDIFSVPVTIEEKFVFCTTDDLNTINSFEYEEKANLLYRFWDRLLRSSSSLVSLLFLHGMGRPVDEQAMDGESTI